MNSKLLSLAAVAALAIGFASSGAQAQSSKFAAHVAQTGDNTHLLRSGVSNTSLPNPDTEERDCAASDTFFATYAGGVCVAADETDIILEADIKTPNKKDLLVGVSLQSGLYTDTSVKGKNGSSEKAGAEAGIMVRLLVSGLDSEGNPAKAYPETVVFSSRVQELNATLGGVIESCDVSLDIVEDGGGLIISASGSFDVSDDCLVNNEEIGLILSTTSANHFNFVVPNLAPGTHTVEVEATALSSAAFLNGFYVVSDLDQGECVGAGGTWSDPNCTFETDNNNAQAWAVVDVGSLTIEEVRATNSPDGVTIEMSN